RDAGRRGCEAHRQDRIVVSGAETPEVLVRRAQHPAVPEIGIADEERLDVAQGLERKPVAPLGASLHARGLAAVARAGPTEPARALNGGPERRILSCGVESDRRTDAVAADELVPDLQLDGGGDPLVVAVEQPACPVVLQARIEQRRVAGG